MSSILEISDVDQSFRTGFWLKRVKILNGINLNVPERSIFGFLGANGAGKTTLIHLITGLRTPVRGTVRLRGDDASSARARARVGYLPERPYFYEHLTGEGLLKYFGALSGMRRTHVVDRIPHVLSAIGMTDSRNVELKYYSKGMLQRIGIGQAIIHDPEFLVLDEPMSGLDPLGRKEVRELILNLASAGRTVFFSTHVIPDVEAICDQVALIQKGRLIDSGPIGQLLAQGAVQAEIGLTGISIEKVRARIELSSVREIPNGLRAIVADQNSVGCVLQWILSEGGTVLWVTPIRPSLEELFVR